MQQKPRQPKRDLKDIGFDKEVELIWKPHANPWVNPTARACTFFRLRRLLSDVLSVGFMVALAAGYPCRYIKPLAGILVKQVEINYDFS